MSEDSVYSPLGTDISTGEIVTGAVTTAKIADLAVTTAKIADAAVTTAKIAGGGLVQEVAETIVSGSAVTSISFTDLDLETDKTYLIFYVMKDISGADTAVAMYANSDTTAANYKQILLQAHDSTVFAVQNNDATAIRGISGTSSAGVITLSKISGEKAKAQVRATINENTLSIKAEGWEYQQTTNITTLTFTASVASSIGIGSRITIFKIGG